MGRRGQRRAGHSRGWSHGSGQHCSGGHRGTGDMSPASAHPAWRGEPRGCHPTPGSGSPCHLWLGIRHVPLLSWGRDRTLRVSSALKENKKQKITQRKNHPEMGKAAFLELHCAAVLPSVPSLLLRFGRGRAWDPTGKNSPPAVWGSGLFCSFSSAWLCLGRRKTRVGLAHPTIPSSIGCASVCVWGCFSPAVHTFGSRLG